MRFWGLPVEYVDVRGLTINVIPFDVGRYTFRRQRERGASFESIWTILKIRERETKREAWSASFKVRQQLRIALHSRAKASRDNSLSKHDHSWNRRMSRVRAKGEHAFRIVKDLWGYTKVRYRGIIKNACQLFTLFALAKIFLVRSKLLNLQA